MSKTAIESQFQQYEKFTYNKHPCEFDNDNDNENDIVSVFQYCELITILGGSAHLEGSNLKIRIFPMRCGIIPILWIPIYACVWMGWCWRIFVYLCIFVAFRRC